MRDSEIIRGRRTELLIREATPDDLEVVAFQLRDPGYPLSPALIKDTFAALLSDARFKILLAVSGSQVVGW